MLVALNRCRRVSTHSRPKAAGFTSLVRVERPEVSTHSRPKAAGMNGVLPASVILRFQLTAARRRLAPSRCGWRLQNEFQLTAARRRLDRLKALRISRCGFNSQPPEGGWVPNWHMPNWHMQFQLTAARRRLEAFQPAIKALDGVSTHSRPKAAGR